jgi:heme/copper-type cytochrome/quinol oxidase subunit 3
MRVVSESQSQPVLPNSVLGMLIFVFTETMLFAGLISGFTIVRSSALAWPPPGQPRLPLEATAVNTVVLLVSGAMLFAARRAFRRDPAAARRSLLLAMLLGGFFVVFQGVEWVALIRQGLTMTSSTLGSFFYLIVGLHALHAVAALGLLAYAWSRLRRGWLSSSLLATAEVL